MAHFRFIPVTPHPLLALYVEKIHVFESSGRLPATERKLIVPNANFKLTLTFRNGIVARIGDETFTQRENELSLTGLIDSPVNLDPQYDTETGTIIIEFNPIGVYRFFHLRYAEVKDRIVDLADLMGKGASDLQSRLAETSSVSMKLSLLQDLLIKRLEKTASDPIYDHCVHRISGSKGFVTVAQLEKETGYSSRWLHNKFSEHLGTGPKNLSEIVRFKQLYHAFSTGARSRNLKEHIYLHYHDQSHFIRAFKRFTGSTPTDLQNSVNELSVKHFTS